MKEPLHPFLGSDEEYFPQRKGNAGLCYLISRI